MLTLVVPCYNEEVRLPEETYVSWLTSSPAAANTRLLFVDDGSRDGTVAILQRIVSAAPPGRASLLKLGINCGKAEAVRRGIIEAMSPEYGSDLVGFWDCDLATPLTAVPQLAAVLSYHPQIQMVFGARVALLGRRIHRSPIRHYLGRVFATLASLSLDLPIYDTQCGAKLFRASPMLRSVVSTPFLTRWVFDCEIIARYHALSIMSDGSGHEQGNGSSSSSSVGGGMLPVSETIYEFPLEEWVDVAGSKVKPTDILRMAYGLLRIRLVYFLHTWPGGQPKMQLYSFIAGACALILFGSSLVLAAGAGIAKALLG
mmetsp:Transcript_20800/g.53071  ORF Transcript_20800/g.53071 Transcript_20800/m.53071 type:complete len:315 (-) Transcript_20800:111-1055(-)